jgi:uncharacterized protein YggE
MFHNRNLATRINFMKFRSSDSWYTALAFATVLLLTDSAMAQNASQLNIGATGHAVRIPNRAWVSFNVSVEPRKTAPEAIDAVAVPVKELLDRLAAKGISGKNVRTSALALAPKYEVKREGGREIRGELLGYVAGKSLVATVEDISQVQAFIREFPLVGRVRISNIGFYSTEVDAAQSEALVDGILRAQKAADRAVTAAGRKLGPVTSIQLTAPTSDTKQTFTEERDYSSDAYGPRLVVEPGEDQFSQEVQLQWTLQ